jgi:hypothetical protein
MFIFANRAPSMSHVLSEELAQIDSELEVLNARRTQVQRLVNLAAAVAKKTSISLVPVFVRGGQTHQRSIHLVPPAVNLAR